jgi:hypothetical protein
MACPPRGSTARPDPGIERFMSNAGSRQGSSSSPVTINVGVSTRRMSSTQSRSEGRRIWTVFDEDAERLDGKASPNQRVNALLRPGEILKNTYRESIDVGLDHGGNVSR